MTSDTEHDKKRVIKSAGKRIPKKKMINNIPMIPATMPAVDSTRGAQQVIPAYGFTPTTANEIQLWNDLQATAAQCSNLQAKVDNLQKKIDLLLRNNSEQENMRAEEYLTDEEDLTRETEWIVQRKKGNKKRKATSSPEISPQNQQKSRDVGTSKKLQTEKVPLPPPINIVGIEKYEEILNILRCASIQDFKVKHLNGVHKVNVNTKEEYCRLQKVLKENNIEHFTYEDKNTRPIKVMARGLDPTCTVQMIGDHLKERNFAIQEVINIEKREKKGEEVIRKRLPLFMLVFSQKEEIKKIYEIQRILGLQVKIEPLRKRSNLIPQCKKCQGYGHTQNNCFKEPRCVKCAGKHLTSKCEKPKHLKAKCINCNEAHPANYRGCMVAKELQKIRNDAIRKQQQNKKSTNVPNPKSSEEDNNKPKTKPVENQATENTYAQKVKNKETQAAQVGPDATSQMLQKIMAKLDQQEKTNKIILERLNKLENSNKKAAANKNKNG